MQSDNTVWDKLNSSNLLRVLNTGFPQHFRSLEQVSLELFILFKHLRTQVSFLELGITMDYSGRSILEGKFSTDGYSYACTLCKELCLR